jgi:predicted  nucleic acid-binding Zn-ribbon protein
MLCGKNPALEAVKSAQDAVKSALAGGKSALASVTSKVTELKSKINGMIPQLPALDSFQAELAGLVGSTPDKIAAFKAKWDGKVADLNNLVAKATSGISGALDFCKDVPNVKMDPATGEAVQEAKEAQTPNENPPEVEKVEPTVKSYESAPSSGLSPATQDDIRDYVTKVTDTIKAQIFSPIQKEINSTTKRGNTLFKQYSDLTKKITDNASSGAGAEKTLEAGIITQSEYDTWTREIEPVLYTLKGLQGYSTKLQKHQTAKERNIADDLSAEEVAARDATEEENFNKWAQELASSGKLPSATQFGTISINFTGDHAKIDAILDANRDLVKKFVLHVYNQPS